MKFKLEISNNSQIVECSGNPLELLLEFTIFFTRQEECRYLLKHSIKMAELAENHIKDGKFDASSLTSNKEEHEEGQKLIADFMKRYESSSSKKV